MTTGDPTDDATRAALNETTFRDVNEGIEEGRREREGLVPFVCECGKLGCNELVMLSLQEYEEIRRGSRRFFVATGHESEFEEVLREEERFTVVEKPDGPLGEIADETDPRRGPE